MIPLFATLFAIVLVVEAGVPAELMLGALAALAVVYAIEYFRNAR